MNIDKLTSETDLKRSNSLSVLDLTISEEEKTIKSPLETDYFLNSVQDCKTDGSIDLSRTSSIYADYHINPFPSCHDPLEKFECEDDDNELPEIKERQAKNFIIDDKCKTETFLPSHERCHNSLAKQEHAFAGALAGTCVSLCLHPVDAVKTVVQSCQAKKSSISLIGKSLISDRGLFGLYRGIATNIASSAPTSAVYTFTYESVKGSLLPLLPREYYSFAHCVAGGCASVATSFVFTPSERIKPQMQIPGSKSQYHNVIHALQEIGKKEGLKGLYRGLTPRLVMYTSHADICTSLLSPDCEPLPQS